VARQHREHAHDPHRRRGRRRGRRAWPIRNAHHIAVSVAIAPSTTPRRPRDPRGPPIARPSDTIAATPASIGPLGGITASAASAASAGTMRQAGLPWAMAAPPAMPRMPPASGAMVVTGWRATPKSSALPTMPAAAR
jgi:hypothetical protein